MGAVFLLVAAFLVGAIPFGYVIARAKGIDIFKVGSGNIGATNVERALGKKIGALVLLLDMLKGLIPALAGAHLVALPAWLGSQVELSFAAGLCAVLGHCFSPFLRFRGGKGVASGIGCLMGSVWPVGVVVLSTFIVAAAITRYVSLASLLAATSMVPAAFVFGYSPRMVVGFVLLAVLVFVRHRANIARLASGTEKRFGSRKEEPSAAEGT